MEKAENETQTPDMQESRINWYVLCAILAVGLVVRIPFIFNESLWPDEGLYLYMAENLLSDLSDLSDYTGKTYYQNPPSFMYLLSLLFRLTGGVSIIAARMLVVLTGVGTIAVVFFIGNKLFGKTAGILAAVLMALNPLHSWISTRVLSDVPLTFLIYLAILFAMTGRHRGSWFVTACAALTKYHSAPMFFVRPGLTLLKKHSRLAVSVYVFGICALGLFIVYKTLFPFENEILYFVAHQFNAPKIQEIIRETKFFLDPAVVVFFVVGFVVAIKRKMYSHLFVWTVLFGTARIFLPWIAFRMSRYTLPIYPAVFLFAAFGAVRNFEFLKKKYPGRVLAIAAVLVSIGCYTGFTYVNNGIAVAKYNNETFLGFDEAGEFLSKQEGNNLSVLTSSPRQISFYAKNLKVFDLPEKAKANDAKRMIEENGIDYVSLDVWSPHQPKWVAEFFSPGNGFAPVYKSRHIIIFKTAKKP